MSKFLDVFNGCIKSISNILIYLVNKLVVIFVLKLYYVTDTQGVYSRTPRFDGNLFPIQTVENVTALKPPGMWLNVQVDKKIKVTFYVRQCPI